MWNLPDSYIECSKMLEEQAIPDNMLYHYTNWLGLKGILESQQLWLTDYRYLNDTSEVKHAVTIIKSYILSKAATGNIQLFWQDIFADIENFISTIVDFFICSFCARPNYLYAWLTYANDGTGFSVGFKKRFFTGETKNTEVNSPNFGRGKVYYNYNEILDNINKLMNIVQDDLIKENALSNSQTAASARDRTLNIF